MTTLHVIDLDGTNPGFACDEVAATNPFGKDAAKESVCAGSAQNSLVVGENLMKD
jgi:hypothetical protein